jgi:hypothetical protein
MDSLSIWAVPIRQEITVVKKLPPYERPPSKSEPGVVDKKKFTKTMKELASKAENMPRAPRATNKP